LPSAWSPLPSLKRSLYRPLYNTRTNSKATYSQLSRTPYIKGFYAIERDTRGGEHSPEKAGVDSSILSLGTTSRSF